MTKVEQFKRYLEAERPKVLDEKARAIAKRIAGSPTESRKFLQEIGSHDKNGNLTPRYR